MDKNIYYDTVNGESIPYTWEDVLDKVRENPFCTDPDEICFFDQKGETFTAAELADYANVELEILESETMKDTSIFENIKELYDIQFHSDGDFWKLFKLTDNAWIFFGAIPKLKNETNKDLYDRALSWYTED